MKRGNKKTALRRIIAGLALLALPMAIVYSDSSVAAVRSKKRSHISGESEAGAERRTLTLTSGEDKIVDIDFDIASHDAIDDGTRDVVIARLVKTGDKRQIVFKPVAPGERTVTVRDTNGDIRLIFLVRVTKSNLLRTAGEIRDMLRDVEGLEVRIVGGKILIEGELLVPGDYGKLLTVISEKPYSDYVINLATLSPLATQVIAKRIQEDVNSFAPNVRTRVVNGIIFLEGSVNSPEEARRSMTIATTYLPEFRPSGALEKLDVAVQRAPPAFRTPIVNHLVINPPPPKKQEKLVRVTVHFVELNKDYNRFFGFKWQPNFTADPQIAVGQNAAGTPGAATAAFSATISSLIPKLNTAQTAGYARILKTSTVLVRSGLAAMIKEVKSYPYIVAGANGQVTPGSSEVGFSMASTPKILGQSDDIEMDLDIEQSNVVGTVAVGAAPQVSKHKVQTKIYVKSGESAAVGGVTGSQVGTDFNKKPQDSTGGEATDPLFTLMHAKSFNKLKGQFVIFVTPEIIENASDGTQDLKKNFRVKASTN